MAGPTNVLNPASDYNAVSDLATELRFGEEMDAAFTELLRSMPSWLVTKVPFTLLIQILKWLIKRLVILAKVLAFVAFTILVPFVLFELLERFVPVGRFLGKLFGIDIDSIVQSLLSIPIVHHWLWAAAVLFFSTGLAIWCVRWNKKESARWAIPFFWTGTLLVSLVAKLGVEESATWTAIAAFLSLLMASAIVVFVVAVKTSIRRFEEAERILSEAQTRAKKIDERADQRAKETDDFIRQYLQNASRTFGKFAESAELIQSLNSALESYPLLKPKVAATLSNWARKWAELIRDIQGKSVRNEEVASADVLAVAQVLEVYVQEEMLDVTKCEIATNLEFYTKLLKSLLDPTWSVSREELEREDSFVELLLKSATMPLGAATGIIDVRTVTPILPRHWWNWSEVGQDENVDVYRTTVDRLANNNGKMTLPPGCKVAGRLEWQRTILVTEGLPQHSNPFSGKIAKLESLKAELKDYGILRYGDHGSGRSILAHKDALGSMSFPDTNIDGDIALIIKEHLDCPKGKSVYAILEKKHCDNVAALARGGEHETQPVYCQTLDSWYLGIHSDAAHASYAIVDESQQRLWSVWLAQNWRTQPPKIPTEFSIFGVRWLDASGMELSRMDFLGIAAPEWDPSRRTMLLGLWFPGNTDNPLEALIAVWDALERREISKIIDSTVETRRSAATKSV